LSNPVNKQTDTGEIITS